MDYVIRRAHLGDLDQLVDFTLSEAMDVEGAIKDREKARQGIWIPIRSDCRISQRSRANSKSAKPHGLGEEVALFRGHFARRI